MRMVDGKVSEVPSCPSTRAGRTEIKDSGERGDGEVSAELLIWRASSTNVIPAEAGMTFKAPHYWFGAGFRFGWIPGQARNDGFIVFLALETPIPDYASSHPV